MIGKRIFVAEFLRQLGTLLRSGMPLPEALDGLAGNVGSRAFRKMLRQVADATRAGQPLATAMAARRWWFSPLEVRLAEVGEQTGTLPAMLDEAAGYAFTSQDLVRRLREATAYPAMVLFACLTIWLMVSYTIVPQFAQMFDEMLAGEPLPALTRTVLGVSNLIRHWALVIFGLWGVLGVLLLWTFIPGRLANRVLHRIYGVVPILHGVCLDFEYARLCRFLALFVRHGLSLPEAFSRCEAALDEPRLRRDARVWQMEHERGRSVAEAFAETPGLDPLLVLAVRCCPEEELAGELDDLARSFQARASTRRQTALAVFHMVVMLVTIGSVAITVLAMFLPLIRLVELLGG